RHISDQQLGRVSRHLRNNPVGVLRALSLPPHHLRHHREAKPDGHRRPYGARGRDAAAARPAHAVLRRASAADHRRERSFNRADHQRLPACCRSDEVGGALTARGSAPRADYLLERVTLMHETAISLPVILPEAVLAAGTLALVLYGAVRGELGSNLINEIA